MIRSLIGYASSVRLPRADGMVLLSGYATQVYGAVVSLAFAPFILRLVGPEAYGLVGIFLIVQAWFQLLDAGMTPALIRQAARYRGGAVSAASLARNVRGMEIVLAATSLPLLLMALLFSSNLASIWLHTDALKLDEVALAFNIMAMILVIRWFSGVRRGLLAGFERNLSLHLVTFVVASLRYPGIVVFFGWFEPTPTNYFLYQLGISLCEMATLWTLSLTLVERTSPGLLSAVRSLRDIASFALTHALLAIVWIAIMQTDKLLLSRSLSLAQFGYFTLAVAAAGGINLVVLPLGQMLKPRLARLHAAGQHDQARQAYRRGTRVAMVSLSGVVGLFLFFGKAVLLLWTGDPLIASSGAPVIGFYALGNLAMVMGSFCYYLQFADGRLGLHSIGSVGKLVIIVPTMYLAISHYGLAGASIAWSIFWIVHLLTWVTYTHHVYLNGLQWRWLCNDVLRIVLPVLLVAWGTARIIVLPTSRPVAALALVGLVLIYTLVAVAVSGLWRRVEWR